MKHTLEGKGLVERRPAEGDRRAHAVHLTEEGRAVLARAEQVAAETARAHVADFTPAEIEQFTAFLVRFVQSSEQGARTLG